MVAIVLVPYFQWLQATIKQGLLKNEYLELQEE